ncbi:hypothetical protein H6F50_20610 [Coleofasciculus sp. FACHB-712]|uniref:hypothetical protein n=1 Tax=Coleofasciculus sp. FACHB-712 TaxID=2692789 RepID=UPI0016898A4B|nr:hypothetical protein [Coleofasciculus sp. FACHB-712]MBD1944730.1 hypothetical protein [Coleofasciculus sp. FACHB-712]
MVNTSAVALKPCISPKLVEQFPVGCRVRRLDFCTEGVVVKYEAGDRIGYTTDDGWYDFPHHSQLQRIDVNEVDW